MNVFGAMLKFSRQAVVTFIAICTLVSIFCAPTRASSSDWLQNSTPQVTQGKTDVGYQPSYPVTCSEKYLFNESLVNPAFRQVCVVDTTIGAVTPDGNIVIDSKDTYRLTDKTGRRNTFILPVPNNNGYIRTYYASTWGAYISKYSMLSKGDLLEKSYNGLPAYSQYEIQTDPDTQLQDDSGTRIRTSGPPLAFSSNGQWMIVDIPYAGLFKVSADLTEMVPFAKSVEQMLPPNSAYYAAISNDGRLVAISSNNNLSIYNLGGCSQHQFTYGSTVSTAGCISRDIWKAHGGVDGIKGQIAGSSMAERLEFINDDTIKFVGRHRDNTTMTNVYDEYYVAAPGSTLHKLAFLGMGDSYISGEGIGIYQEGTDTNDNKCHLSPQSYPYLIGAQLYDSHRSVACSGAKTTDVDGLSDKYGGQTKIKQELGKRSPDKYAILESFSPGYAQQLQFTKEYRPKTALISIGGNDVKFADMVKSCVVPEPTNPTCYSTYQERKQKAGDIYKLFDPLVTTYSNILSNGTENLYVVGYPRVAKENGNCAINVHLNNDEIIFSNEIVHYLNQVIEAAADKAGARYVDIENALDGHRLCEAKSNNIAVNGLTMGNDAGVYVPFVDWQLGPLEKASYHPNALGHRLIMKAILDQTDDMHEPMPAKDNNAKPPQVTDDMPLLAGLTPAPELPNLESVDDITNGTLVRGTPTALYVDGLAANTAPNTEYRVELHSSPTILGYLTSDANGNISGKVTIPGDIAPGIHTLNLYGPSYGGEQIQIQQFVYVAASEDDADGNGVPNNQQPCIVIEPSLQDIDGDGIDDACDPVIGEPIATIETPQDGMASNTGTIQTSIAQNNFSQPQTVDRQAPEESRKVLGDTTVSKNNSNRFDEESPATNFWLESLVVAGILAFTAVLILRSKSSGEL